MAESIYQPKEAKITNIKQMTGKEKLFEIQLQNNQPLNHNPGQFIELSLPGYGEAPFSVASSPTRSRPGFQLCIRAVGNLTNALHRKKPGDKVGIRGPLGNGFPLKKLEGNDLVFIAGGLGLPPLRSLINYVEDKSHQFGDTHILYGCKVPSEQLFTDELCCWREENEFQFTETVDEVPEEEQWNSNVGVVTTIIPEADLDKNTKAVTCGPLIMLKFVVKELKERNLPSENIYLSLERRMECGVGKCGHCQINDKYVCKDGPVFSYKEIENLPEALI